MHMRQIDTLPESVKAALTAAGAVPEDFILCVAGDLEQDLRYGEVWLCVDQKALWTYFSDGVRRILLDEIGKAGAESHVGSDPFVLQRGEEMERLCVFTNTATRKFLILAKVINRLKEGAPLRVADF